MLKSRQFSKSSTPDTARIDRYLRLEEVAVDALKLAVIHQQQHNVRRGQRLAQFDESDIRGLAETRRQLLDVWFDDKQLAHLFTRQPLDNVQRRALP